MTSIIQLGCIPFGYDVTEDGAFVVVEKEARIVREIIANVAVERWPEKHNGAD